MYGLNNRLKRGLMAFALVALCAAAAAGQSRDEHLISAKPGGVNFVSGDVKFRPEGAQEWRRLTDSDMLETGDAVATGATGQAEVLLNPGTYLRLGANSEFRFADAFLDNLRLELTRGSAIVEAVGFDRLDINLLVDTPHTRVSILRSGLYRVNVSGVTEVAVVKGRAEVGREQVTKLKGGRLMRVGAGVSEVVKLDKKNTDSLDEWSRGRAETLAKINQKLSRREMNTIFARTDWNSLWPTTSTGSFWFFNRATRCWILLPGGGGYWAWMSPYGFSYDRHLFYGGNGSWGGCSTCANAPRNPHAGGGNGYGNPPPGGYGNGGGSGNGGGYGNGNGGGNNNPPPPPRDTAAPREFVRPSMDAPRPMPAERSASPGPAMQTRDQ